MLVFKLLLSPKEERNKIHKKEAKKNANPRICLCV